MNQTEDRDDLIANKGTFQMRNKNIINTRITGSVDSIFYFAK
jgi:hypothetical protein